MKEAIVDLFCGVGGLTCGLRKAGLKVVAGIDSDASCEYAYHENNKAKFIHADISKYSADDVNKLFGSAKIKILVGCAPCQTFSAQARKIRDKRAKDDIRWHLLDYFGDYVEKINPDIVSMENVPELEKFDVFKKFEERLREMNYYVKHWVIDCVKYGLPQKRRRLVLLASKYAPIDIISSDSQEFEHKRTVRDIIESLDELRCGETDKNDKLHRSAGLTPKNLERIKHSKPGGTWHDWPEDLLNECHKKSTGQDFTSVYGRMRWDEPSPTITTQFFYIGAGRYGHPEQNRAISLREGALLQTFPKSYTFFKDEENMSIATIARHIGNAVPVDLGKIIGLSIKKHLRKVKECRKITN